ncbi:MAG TPA: luciferase family protein [Cyclobacteriaceae bacterium]
MILHPAFVFNLPYLVTKPLTQKLLRNIETEVLKWDDTTSGIHSMGGIGFYFLQREFGHIHWNGDLDIVFGRPLTSELLKSNHVQRHNYAAEVAITFKLKDTNDIPSANSLLRLAYLKVLKKAPCVNCKMINVQAELDKLSFDPDIKGLI